jgi:hypothetical protein
MTLLTMDLAQKPAPGTFAGFTLEYTGPNGVRTPLKNLLNFADAEGVTESTFSPYQAFKWVHFPGSFSQNPLPPGNWNYHATPRFFSANKQLLPLDASKTVTVTIPVGDFSKAGISVGFTRAFLKSQAYANRYGANTRLKPAHAAGAGWLFDTSAKAGNNPNFGDFTYEDMYLWLGYTARRQLYDALDDAIADNTVAVEMFAYDLNDPGIANRCLNLAGQGRIRIILDDAALHSTAPGALQLSEEDDFTQRFNAAANPGAAIFRCHFARYSHSKVIILKRNNAAFRVLTGATNFAVTGLCVNANHVVIFDRGDVAQYYSDVFNACWQVGTAGPFRASNFANATKVFNAPGFPHTEINFAPHNPPFAENLLDAITAHIRKPSIRSVLFAVMEMGTNSTGSLIRTLRELHKNDAIFTYGVTDNSSGDISLYKPGRKNGLLIDAKKAKRELPLPFKTEANLPGHAIHHKFVITNFNRATARVYCGSSNLALGGEKQNGDNLICIKDADVATAFAIEAMRLTEHYNYRSVREPDLGQPNQTPRKLDNTGAWVNKFFDPADIRCVEREVLAGS